MTAVVSPVAATAAIAEAVRLALAPYRAGTAQGGDLARLHGVHASIVRVRTEAEADARRLYDRAHDLTLALNAAGPPTPQSFGFYQLETEGLHCADERRAFARDLATLEQALLEVISDHEGTLR
jgi:hypothetical protein